MGRFTCATMECKSVWRHFNRQIHICINMSYKWCVVLPASGLPESRAQPTGSAAPWRWHNCWRLLLLLGLKLNSDRKAALPSSLLRHTRARHWAALFRVCASKASDWLECRGTVQLGEAVGRAGLHKRVRAEVEFTGSNELLAQVHLIASNCAVFIYLFIYFLQIEKKC